MSTSNARKGTLALLHDVESGGDVDSGACPPHHWDIVNRYEDGYREERWSCRRCGDEKLIRVPTWAGNGRRMSNTSTWTTEDKILGGDEDEEAPLMEREQGRG